MSDDDWAKKVIDRLKTKIVPHRNFEQARARLMAAMLVRQPGECLGLVGPSRNGKTTIVEEVEYIHNPQGAAQLMERRPVVLLRVRNKSDKGHFTTKTFYINALQTINHPFFELTGTDLFENADRIRRMHGESNDTLADILENALKILGIKYLIIDETQHFSYMVGGDKSACQILESLKTMAESLGCVIIFVGAYPILRVLSLAPHILGREYVVHLPRYKTDKVADIRAFEQTLQWFSEGIVFEGNVNSLRDWNEFLFDGVHGVPGLLSAWVRNAISEMQARGDLALSLNHLKFSKKAMKDNDELLSEIVAGEDYLQAWSYDDEPEVVPDPKEEPSPKTSDKKSPSRPFKTKPKRRPAGGRI